MIAQMEDAHRRIENSPGGVRQFLIENGFMEEDGTLGKLYREMPESAGLNEHSRKNGA